MRMEACNDAFNLSNKAIREVSQVPGEFQKVELAETKLRLKENLRVSH